MAKRLRFTGEYPPPELWARYPNWENAYDEEGVRGRDETTDRPAKNQQTIDDDLEHTAGDAIFIDGRTLPAYLYLTRGVIGSVQVYPNPNISAVWVLDFHDPSKQWVAMNDDYWFVNNESRLKVPLDDAGVFPLRIRSRLPLRATGKPIEITIDKPKLDFWPKPGFRK